MKRTYKSPFAEVIATDLQYALMQGSKGMKVNTDVIIEGKIEDEDKLSNGGLWDYEE